MPSAPPSRAESPFKAGGLIVVCAELLLKVDLLQIGNEIGKIALDVLLKEEAGIGEAGADDVFVACGDSIQMYVVTIAYGR